MRVVGGIWGGRRLEAPEGRGTRPTTDRWRGAVASMLLSARGLSLEGASVLDAFAGSGALGIELLSRGACRCTFVERDARAAACVRANLARVGAAPGAARVVRGDVLALARSGGVAGGPFGIVVLDPPYATSAQAVRALLGDLARTGALAEGALVAYERAAQADSLDAPPAGARGEGGAALSPGDGAGRLVALRTRSHGTTAMDLLRWESA